MIGFEEDWPESDHWVPAHPKEMVAAVELLVMWANGKPLPKVRAEAIRTGAEEIGRWLLKEGIIVEKDVYDVTSRNGGTWLRLVVCDRREKK